MGVGGHNTINYIMVPSFHIESKGFCKQGLLSVIVNCVTSKMQCVALLVLLRHLDTYAGLGYKAHHQIEGE